VRYLLFIILLLTSCKTIKISEKENFLDNYVFKPEISEIKNLDSEEDNFIYESPKILKSQRLDINNIDDNIKNIKEDKFIKETYKNITNGQIIYKVPDTMQVMKNYDVIVRISKSSDNIQITENINGKITHKNITTSSRMEVNLIDASDAFKIKKINTDKQLVDSTYTEWRFSVMPIKSGTNKLNLVVSIIKDDDVKQIVYSDEIFVRSNPPAQIKTFWYDNWKWSMEKILIPIITWLIGIWIGKRKKRRD